jgi:hypothetical protein
MHAPGPVGRMYGYCASGIRVSQCVLCGVQGQCNEDRAFGLIEGRRGVRPFQVMVPSLNLGGGWRNQVPSFTAPTHKPPPLQSGLFRVQGNPTRMGKGHGGYRRNTCKLQGPSRWADLDGPGVDKARVRHPDWSTPCPPFAKANQDQHHSILSRATILLLCCLLASIPKMPWDRRSLAPLHFPLLSP